MCRRGWPDDNDKERWCTDYLRGLIWDPTDVDSPSWERISWDPDRYSWENDDIFCQPIEGRII